MLRINKLKFRENIPKCNDFLLETRLYSHKLIEFILNILFQNFLI